MAHPEVVSAMREDMYWGLPLVLVPDVAAAVAAAAAGAPWAAVRLPADATRLVATKE